LFWHIPIIHYFSGLGITTIMQGVLVGQNHATQGKLAKVGFKLAARVAKWLGLDFSELKLATQVWAGGTINENRLDGKLTVVILNSNQPIGMETSPEQPYRTRQHTIVAVAKTGKPLADLFRYILFGLQIRWTIAKGDAPIWNNMAVAGGGAYAAEDFAVQKFRKFYHSWVD
jgi:hypothetical protein